MLNRTGYVRFRTARDIPESFVYLIRGSNPARFCQNGNRFPSGFGKDFGTSEYDSAILYFPADSAFTKELVEAN